MIPPAGPEIFAELAAGAIRQPIADLAGHGAVEVSLPSAHPKDQLPGTAQEAARGLGTQPWALFPVPGIQVRLTELGKYAVRERLLAEGAPVPLTGTEVAGPVTPSQDALSLPWPEVPRRKPVFVASIEPAVAGESAPPACGTRARRQARQCNDSGHRGDS